MTKGEIDLISEEFEKLLDGNSYVSVRDIYVFIAERFGLSFSEVKSICEYQFRYVNEFIVNWDIEDKGGFEGVWLKYFGKFITNHYRLSKDEKIDRDS